MRSGGHLVEDAALRLELIRARAAAGDGHSVSPHPRRPQRGHGGRRGRRHRAQDEGAALVRGADVLREAVVAMDALERHPGGARRGTGKLGDGGEAGGVRRVAAARLPGVDLDEKHDRHPCEVIQNVMYVVEETRHFLLNWTVRRS